MTFFKNMMISLFMYNAISRKTLHELTGDGMRTVNKQIKKAISLGLAREMRFKTKYHGRQETLTLIVLTQKGTRYVFDYLDKYIPFLSFADVPETMVFFPRAIKTDEAIRYTKITDVAVMAINIGADVPPISFSRREQEAGFEDDTRDKVSLAGIIDNAYKEYKDQRRELTGQDSATLGDAEIVFVDSVSLKAQCNTQNNGMRRHLDINGGRYCGVLSSQFRTVFVYESTKTSPLVWYKKFFERERRAYNVFVPKLDERIRAKHDTSFSGILIVESPSDFYDAFFSNLDDLRRRAHNRGRIRERAEELGRGMKHFWVVMRGYAGCQELHSLMTRDIERDTESIVEWLVQSGSYERERSISEDVFPLHDLHTDMYVSVGIHIDVSAIHMIRTITSIRPDEAFAIICYDWQIPFYNQVLEEDISYIRVDDLFPIKDWESYKPRPALEREVEIWNESQKKDKRIILPAIDEKRSDVKRKVPTVYWDPLDLTETHNPAASQENTDPAIETEASDHNIPDEPSPSATIRDDEGFDYDFGDE